MTDIIGQKLKMVLFILEWLVRVAKSDSKLIEKSLL